MNVNDEECAQKETCHEGDACHQEECCPLKDSRTQKLRGYMLLVGVFAVVLVAAAWYKGKVTVPSSTTPQPLLKVNNLLPQSQNYAANIPYMGQNVMALPVARNTFTDVVELAEPFVVNISAIRLTTMEKDQPLQNVFKFVFPFSGVGFESLGSGVVITQDGYILTNYHAIEGADIIYVSVVTGKETTLHQAEVIQLAERLDLALIKIEPPVPLRPAILSKERQLWIGQDVMAFGRPMSLEATVSKGIVSGLDKSITIDNITHRKLIQTDASVNLENSGGPLVDMRGYVVGINTAIQAPNGEFDGAGFAVPSKHAVEFVEAFVALPDRVPNLNQHVQAVTVAAVNAMPIVEGTANTHDDRGPCFQCHQILPQNAAFNQFSAPQPQPAPNGTNVAFTSPQPSTLWLGTELTPVSQALKDGNAGVSGGVFLSSVAAGSNLDNAGLRAGDIIFRVDGKTMDSPNDLYDFTRNKQGTARVSVIREGTRRNVYVELTP
ncbi:trypsin-like peptidase domain-containing protein [Deltaproteobacteria bacterium TL4]